MDTLLRRLLQFSAILPQDSPLTHVGWTGTQYGMTIKQADAARKVLSGLENLALHHGDCRGSDYQAHALARELGHFVVIHPPANPAKRAWAVADLMREVKPYLDRNKDIVDETEILIATPKTRVEELRSGTWSTIRYARKHGKAVIIIYPDGEVETLLPS